MKWEAWDYQLELLNEFLNHSEIVILKARQLGISWLLSGYALWVALFSESAKVLFLSQGEDEAWEMISKAKFIWAHLPDFLRLPLEQDTRSLMKFKDTASQLKALPSTANAGRSTDASLVIRDELATHPYGEENYDSVYATANTGGQLIDLGTINKMDAENHLTSRVQKAKSGALCEQIIPEHGRYFEKYTGGESGATLIFTGWKLRPVRLDGMSLDEWYERYIVRKYKGRELKREQEYPATIDEALAPAQTKLFFDKEAVADMEYDISNPIPEIKDINTHNGIVRIWQLPVVGKRYVIFADPSDGVDDPHAIIVMRWDSGDVVAVSHGKIKADECARIFDSLVRFYNDAFNSNEINATAGGRFDETIKNLETPSRAPFRNPDGKIVKNKFGWFTSDALRQRMLDKLEESIRKRTVTVHYKPIIEELQSFVRPEDGSKPQASMGQHDDLVIALAGADYIRQFATVSKVSAYSFKYRTSA